jgi:hypothetical protein
MRSRVKWFLMAFVVLTAAPAFGQAPLAQAPLANLISTLENGVDAPFLLANASVKKEINLTDEQCGKVRKIVKEVYDKYQPDMQKARTDRDQKKWLELVGESTQETRERVHKALPDILMPEQFKRLKQIEIQVNGILSFKKPEVQKKLELTDKQKEEIRGIGDGLKQDVAGTLKDVASAPLRKGPEALRKVRELKNDATRKAVDTLTVDQKKTWKEMTGETFELKLDGSLLPRGGS